MVMMFELVCAAFVLFIVTSSEFLSDMTLRNFKSLIVDIPVDISVICFSLNLSKYVAVKSNQACATSEYIKSFEILGTFLLITICVIIITIMIKKGFTNLYYKKELKRYYIASLSSYIIVIPLLVFSVASFVY